ncbi:MAG TPA: hypothetical protein DDW94_00440 [Deltaproteobacteria bacterium]|nr:MAG: hypothetical protein A2Z79_05805 [Deltaproteobacteria bacterium GWA2_55_82]OGQ62384.1 MAG: hypothetical protein A3I81_01240 [Deltaproteobacteria bacterium RIFCSPLOWO2_02_FULL_55_12]OIJ73296.1 MAG: hypothetical protein A2V21_302855 [Deltaproteobacteria bacterium GWC2_55_46]HBG45436.1 hypothetical protein [Deltaproteobacteria bacterium]HCY10267.1 hypothetical protein [Deltaproteobacteria bacterium]
MRWRTEDGFTLIEVVIAMTILSIGILGIAGLAGTAAKNSGYSQSMSLANNLSQEKLEALLSVDYNNIQVTDTTAPRADLRRNCTQTSASVSRPVYSCTPVDATLTSGNKSFTWSYTVTYIDLSGNGVANPTLDGLKRIDVTVSWTDALWHATKSVTLATMRTKG